MSLIDWFKNNAPKPANPQSVSLSKYVQAWAILRNIPVAKLFPAVVSVSTVVFFAISGVFAWLVLFGAFVCKLVKLTFKWLRIWS